MRRLDLYVQSISKEISDEENTKNGFEISSEVRIQILRYFKDVNDINLYESYIETNVSKDAFQFLFSWVKKHYQEIQKLKSTITSEYYQKVKLQQDQQLLSLFRIYLWNRKSKQFQQKLKQKYPKEYFQKLQQLQNIFDREQQQQQQNIQQNKVNIPQQSSIKNHNLSMKTNSKYLVILMKIKEKNKQNNVDKSFKFYQIGLSQKKLILDKKTKPFGEYLCVILPIQQEKDYEICFSAGVNCWQHTGLFLKKHLKNKYNFFFDYCLDVMQDTTLVKISFLKTIIYTIYLVPFQTDSSIFFFDLLQKIKSYDQTIQNLYVKEKEQDDILNLTTKYSKKTLCCTLVMISLYQKHLYDFSREQKNLQCFQKNILFVCLQKLQNIPQSQQFKKYQILSHQTSLKIKYLHRKKLQNQKMDSEFQSLLIESQLEKDLIFLIQILAEDYDSGKAKKKVFTKIGIIKQKILKSKFCRLQKLYCLLVYQLYNFQLSHSKDKFKDIFFDILSQIKIQSQNNYEQKLQKYSYHQNQVKLLIKKIYDEYLEFDVQDIKKMFNSIATLPQSIICVLISQKLQSIIHQTLSKSKIPSQKIYLIKVFYQRQYKQKQPLISLQSIRMILKGLFQKKVRNMFVFQQTKFELLSQNNLKQYVGNLIYFILQTNLEQDKKIIISYFIKSLTPQWLCYDIFQCLNQGLIHKNYDHIRAQLINFFRQTMNQCCELQIWKPIQITTEAYWQSVFASQPILKQFLIDFTINKINKFQSESDNQQLKQLMNNLLNSEINMSSQDKTELTFKILNDQNINYINQQKVINEIFSTPLQIKNYLQILKKDSKTVKNKILNVLRQISGQIKKTNISYYQLTCYNKLNQQNLNVIKNLFDFVGFDFNQQMQKIDSKSKDYLFKLKMTIEIIDLYQKVLSLKKIKQLANNNQDSHKNSDFISFNQDEEIKPFLNLISMNPSLVRYAIIINNMDIENNVSVNNFIQKCHEITNKEALFIINTIQKHIKNELDLDELIIIIQKLKDKQIEQIFSIRQKIEKQQLKNIIQIKKVNKQKHLLSIFIQSILFFQEIFKFFENDHKKVEIKEYYEQIKSQKIKTKTFWLIAQQVQKIKSQFQIKNEVLQIVNECANFKHFYAKLLQLNTDLIQDLDDYITYEEQSQISLKQINQLKFAHAFVHKVLSKSSNFKEFRTNLTQLMSESNKYQSSLQQSLKECKNSMNQFFQAFKQSQDRESSFKYNLIMIMNNSSVIGTFDSQKLQRSIKIKAQKRTFQFKQISSWRDKSLLIINNIKRYQKSEKQIALLQDFIMFNDCFSRVIHNYLKLDTVGYLKQFAEKDSNIQHLQLKIRQSNFSQVKNHSEIVQIQYDNWKQKSSLAFQSSFVLCHFEGKQLFYLAHKIFVAKQYFFSLKKILENILKKSVSKDDFWKAFKQQEQKIKQTYNGNLNIANKLQVMKNAFNFLTKEQIQETKLWSGKDKKQQKMIIRCLKIQEKKFFEAIPMYAKSMKHIQKIDLPQILLCRQSTTYQQINKFLLRTVHDIQKQYLIIGTSRLTSNVQNDFCKILQNLLDNQVFKNQVKYAQLCFIDNSSIQKVYNFMVNNKDISLIQIQNSRSQNQYFETKAGKLQIIHSKRAGLGKTFFISQKIRQQNLNIKYLPVAGQLSYERLLFRLKQLKVDQNSALVIQIHNIKNPKLLDEFLFQIIYYKCLKVEQFFYLPENLQIAIQLENIHNQNHFDKYQSLRLLQNNKTIVKQLKDIKQEDIVIDVKDSKLMFVMIYLKWFRDKNINEEQVSYSDFKRDYLINEKYFLNQYQCQKLLGKYFLNYFESKNTKPSYIQLHSFIKSLFQSLIVFANSPFFLKQSIDFTMKPLGIKDFRQKFMSVLLNNSLNFLNRALLLQNNEMKLFEQIRKFQFFILPNADLMTYSFLYKDHKHLDIVIKQFILIQNRVIKTTFQFIDRSFIQRQFEKYSVSSLNQIHLKSKLFQSLRKITNQKQQQIKESSTYSLTLDNFFKMCLVIQRMRSMIPIIIMGQTGVGKTALLKFLVQQVYKQKLHIVNIHSGVDENSMIQIVKQMKEKAVLMKKNNQKTEEKVKQRKLWVFFDEFNTTEQLGSIKQIVIDRKFLGEPLGEQFGFICACNPYKKVKQVSKQLRVGLEKRRHKNNSQELIYNVFPPPESMIQSMWNYEQLKKQETEIYIKTILRDLRYSPNVAASAVVESHEYFRKNQKISKVNLRDVVRVKILFDWFLQYMPVQKLKDKNENQNENESENFNFQIPREERAFILSLCLCYYLRIQNSKKRDQYLDLIQRNMKKQPGYFKKIFLNQQRDYLDRIEKPPGIALNEALRQNVFCSFVCIMNKLPMIIVGKPGSSKSLAIKLLLSNLKGKNSKNQYFRQFPEVKTFFFQGSESCTSQGIQKTYRTALNKTQKDKIPLILFDQIGLAELSEHKPLKILHSYLELTEQRKVAFIGISNWELDASKMSRSLIINRPIPDEQFLYQTALQIFQKQNSANFKMYSEYFKCLSLAYYNFMEIWSKDKYNNKDFYGLRDFYSLIKQCCFYLSKISPDQISSDHQIIQNVIVKSVYKNFDGRNKSIQYFLDCLKRQIKQFNFKAKQWKVVQLIEQNFKNKKNSRCLLQIIKGQSLVHFWNQSPTIRDQNKIINIHGSTFQQDIDSQTYIISIVEEIINYVSQGYVLILKDIPNSILTSLYDLLNKDFHSIGGKRYCRIGVGSYYNPRCFVHADFNCVVYIMQNKLDEVDPPFLNRFQKHYLILDQFMGEKELKIFQQIRKWEAIIFKEIEQNSHKYLSKDSFLLNDCNESLASLAIKLVNEDSKASSQNLIIKAKEALLFNTTTDFQIYLSLIKDKISQTEFKFIQEKLKFKEDFIKNTLFRSQKLIVFTYDQNISVNDQNILVKKDMTKIIKIFEIKCEKELKYQIQEFYAQDKYQTCQIILEYEKQHQHLCLIIFLLDSYLKKIQKQKRICIVVVLSRIKIVSSPQKYEQISYLNGFTQIFIESLETNFVKITKIPDSGQLLYQQFKLQNIVPNFMTKAIKRFDWTYLTENQNEKNLQHFNNLLRNLQQNTLFRKLNQIYLLKKWQNCQNNKNKIKQQLNNQFQGQNEVCFKEWKYKLIQKGQLCKIAQTTASAMNIYFANLFQDWLSCFISWLVQNQVIYCFDYKKSVEILQEYVPGISKYLQQNVSAYVFKQQYNKMLQNRITNYFEKQQPFAKVVSRNIGQQKCVLRFPKLFPFSHKQIAYIFRDQTKFQIWPNKIKPCTLEEICDQMRSFQKQYHIQNNNNNLDTKFLELIQNANQLIDNKTELKMRNNNGQIVEDYLQKINKKQNSPWLALRNLLIMDLRNIFLFNLTKSEIQKSFLFNQILDIFKKDVTTLQKQILILMIGSQLWTKLIQIYRVLSKVSQSKLLENFVKKYGIRKTTILFQSDILQFFNERFKFVNSLIQYFSKKIYLNKANVEEMSNLSNYSIVFDNVFNILQNLENDYSEYEYNNVQINVPLNLRVIKNFKKLLQSLADNQNQSKELIQKFLDNQQKASFNIYQSIQKFLKQLSQDNKYYKKRSLIFKYQANTLHRIEFFQVLNEQDQNQAKVFITKFASLVNEEVSYAHNCTNILMSIFEDFFPSQQQKRPKTIQSLLNKQLNMTQSFISDNIALSQLKNNMTIVVVDLFCKFLMKDVGFQEGESQDAKLLKPIEKYFDQFQKLIKIKKQDQLNGIQNAIFLAFCRTFLTQYVKCLEGLKAKVAHSKMKKIDIILQEGNFISDNLKIFCLNLIKQSKKSNKKFKQRYIDIDNASWIIKFKQKVKFYSQNLLKTSEIILEDSSSDIDLIISSLMTANTINIETMKKIIQREDLQSRYKFLDFFLKKLYSTEIQVQNKQQLFSFLQNTDKLSKFQVQILKCYVNKKITDNLVNDKKTQVQIINDHIWQMNNINWLLCIKSSKSPLTSIFFIDSHAPPSFSKHISQQLLLLQQQNTMKQQMKNIKQSFSSKSIIYKCEDQCSFMSTNGFLQQQQCMNCMNCQVCRKPFNQIVGPKYLAQTQFKNKMSLNKKDTHQLQSMQIYRKIISFYIQLEIDKIDQKNKQLGFHRFEQANNQRINQLTHIVLKLILDSIYYVWIELKFISNEECNKAFSGQSSKQMSQYFFKSLQINTKKLKSKLNFPDWRLWLIGIQKQIFYFTLNFQQNIQEHQKNETKLYQQFKQQVKVFANSSENKNLKQFFKSVLQQNKTFFLQNKEMRKNKYYFRQFYQQSIQSIVRKHSGQNIVIFMKNLHDSAIGPDQKYLEESHLSEIEDENEYHRALRYTQDPSTEHLKRFYDLKINQQYPILDLVIRNKSKFQTLFQFLQVILFLNKVFSLANYRIIRQDSKKLTIEKFCSLHKPQLDNLKYFLQCLNKVIKESKMKTELETIKDYKYSQYTGKTNLFNFLLLRKNESQKQDQNQSYYGRIISKIYHVFAIKVNELIDMIQIAKNKCSGFKSSQLFSHSTHHVQKIKQKDIPLFSKTKFQLIVNSFSSSSIKNRVPYYDFETIQNKIFICFYGKKRLNKNQNQFMTINFIGQNLQKANNGQYLSQIRRLGANISLTQQELHIIQQQRFKDIKKQNLSKFYSIIKQFQGFLQQTMAFYKNSKIRNVTISSFINSLKLKRVPQIIKTLPFRQLPIECLISLYQVGQKAIFDQTIGLLDEKYSMNKLQNFQVQQIKKLLRQMQKNENKQCMPTLSEFKNALNRFTSRCLLYKEIDNSENLFQCLKLRKDIWPFDYNYHKLNKLSQLSIELSQVGDLYEIINDLNENQRPQEIPANNQEPVKSIKKLKKTMVA